jgi:ferric-dicitrate binding protein FerR (iron transport regulator)
MLLAKNAVLSLLIKYTVLCSQRVRTIEVEVQPLSGDNFKVALDARKPLVSETKKTIARAQGTREAKQELYRVAQDSTAVYVDDDDMELKDGEVVAMVVTDAVELLHAAEERTVEGHDGDVMCMVTS